MFSSNDSSIFRVSRKLWPLPIIVIPGLLVICFFAPALFSWKFIVSMFVIQIAASAAVWKGWKGTEEQLTGVKLELSTLQDIVDVSRDAIIAAVENTR